MEAILGRNVLSLSVRPPLRVCARRVKRTSLGVCSRDCVMVKIFSGAKYGRVEMRASRAEMKRMLKDL